jgi:O-acetylhomoserine/O-acetylserine sulfhydrylase-like pyridoxal-dependent enzyme
MALYGGTTSIMREVKKYGITVDFFETTETDEIIKMIKPNTKVLYNLQIFIRKIFLNCDFYADDSL